jgi:hypothetical protein
MPRSQVNSTRKNPHAVALGKLGGSKGGRARAENLSADELSAISSKAGKAGGPARAAKLSSQRRSEIARKAALARWKKHSSETYPLRLRGRRNDKP